ncbi:MAG: hypothetical protein FJ044_01280 [Candidatus Cloacimonetes bacterium]|nr:hypothetical protein [Candidatus Cloacimonadota bacterium]
MKSKREKLPNLPPSEDKYWNLADKEKIELDKKPECSHFFEHKTAREVECRNCHIGFYLDIGWIIKNGHIYKDKQFVI